MLNKPSLWRQIFRKNFTRLEELSHFLELTKEQQKQLLSHRHFGLNLPIRLAQKIQKTTLNDPILKQFVPLNEEAIITPGFQNDPVNDMSFRKETKLLQKYAGRALLICTSACAMHCRYCFRQNFTYDQQKKSFAQEIELIRQDTSLHEIILSGGDPLSLDDRVLKDLIDSLENIPHIKRIRFHTRFPIGIPERLDDHFLSILKNRRVQFWFVLHINHPNELDQEIFMALKNLHCLGIPLLNQSVLLKGINDDSMTQHRLCELLVDHGILPYYLHQLDRVQGAAHFEVDEDHGRQLIREMTQSLAGYAIPKYVSEIPGRMSKTRIE